MNYIHRIAITALSKEGRRYLNYCQSDKDLGIFNISWMHVPCPASNTDRTSFESFPASGSVSTDYLSRDSRLTLQKDSISDRDGHNRNHDMINRVLEIQLYLELRSQCPNNQYPVIFLHPPIPISRSHLPKKSVRLTEQKKRKSTGHSSPTARDRQQQKQYQSNTHKFQTKHQSRAK